MRILILSLGFFIIAIPVWTQDNQMRAPTDRTAPNGIFGGPVLKVTEINNVFGLIVGGRGGWICGHTFIIGGGLYGLLRDVEVDDAGAERNFEFAYSGLELEYIILPRQVIHLSVQTLIGLGALTDRERHFDRFASFNNFDGPDDSFFIVEPGLNLMWNMKTHLRVGLGGSYRFIRGVGLEGLSNSDLSGLSTTVIFKFGRF